MIIRIDRHVTIINTTMNDYIIVANHCIVGANHCLICTNHGIVGADHCIIGASHGIAIAPMAPRDCIIAINHHIGMESDGVDFEAVFPPCWLIIPSIIDNGGGASSGVDTKAMPCVFLFHMLSSREQGRKPREGSSLGTSMISIKPGRMCRSFDPFEMR